MQSRLSGPAPNRVLFIFIFFPRIGSEPPAAAFPAIHPVCRMAKNRIFRWKNECDETGNSLDQWDGNHMEVAFPPPYGGSSLKKVPESAPQAGGVGSKNILCPPNGEVQRRAKFRLPLAGGSGAARPRWQRASPAERKASVSHRRSLFRPAAPSLFHTSGKAFQGSTVISAAKDTVSSPKSSFFRRSSP